MPARAFVAVVASLTALRAWGGADLPPATVDIRGFGAIGDGVADDSAAFEALGTWLRAHDGTTVLIPAGTYSYRDNRWLQGVRNVRVIGSGARLRCTGAMAPFDWESIALLTNADPFREGAGYQPTHRFASASAGARTVQLANPRDAADYQPGDWVLVFGYVIYPGGWPPSTRYHELAQVAAVGASEVTFVRPLRNGYDDRWYDAPGAVPVGAPRLLRLSRRSTFVLAEDIYIEGIEFLKGPHEPSYFSRYDRGAVYAKGALSITLVRCKLGNLNPTQVARFRAIDCEIDNLEVDKLVDSAVFERSRIGDATGGTGADSVVFRDCDLLESVALQARTILLDHCSIRAAGGTRFAVVDAAGESITLRDNVLWRRPGENTPMLHGGPPPLPLRVVSASGRTIRFAFDRRSLQPFLALHIGARLRTRSRPLNEATVEAIYWDGTYAVVEAELRRPANAGDVFYLSGTGDFHAEGNVEVGGGPRRAQQTAGANRAESFQNDSEAGARSAGQLVVSFPRDGGLVPVTIPGYLVEVEFMVLDPAQGTTVVAYPTGGEKYWSLQVNAGIAGVRRCDSLSCAGLQQGDAMTLLPPPGAVYDQLNIVLKRPSGNAPRGAVVFRYVQAD